MKPKAYTGARDYASYAYDAVWAIALTLNRSIDRLANIDRRLEDIHYNDKEALAIFMEQMQSLEFSGITVRFYTNF